MGLIIDCHANDCAATFTSELFRDVHERVNHGGVLLVHGPAPTLFDWRPPEWRHENLRKYEASKQPAPIVAGGYQPTSYEAWIASLPKLRETERGIVELLHASGPLTDEELYDAYTADHPAAYRNTVLPARTGLANAGIVKDTGAKRQVRSGRNAIVWGLPL